MAKKVDTPKQIRQDAALADRAKSLAEKVEDKVSQALMECLAQIPNQIRYQVNNVVAKSLGFECRCGEWNVDHCNGRQSAVSELVAAAARQQVADIVRRASEEFTPTQEQIEAIKRDMSDRYKDAVRKAVGDALEKMVATESEKLVKELLPDFAKIATDIKAMANPSYGARGIEQVVMMARAITNGEEFDEEG